MTGATVGSAITALPVGRYADAEAFTLHLQFVFCFRFIDGPEAEVQSAQSMGQASSLRHSG